MLKKYNRTFHLSCSAELTGDDKLIAHENDLLNVEIVMTEKLDGGNSMFEDIDVFARTHSVVAKHGSFSMLKAISSILYSQGHLPKGLKVFGENMQGIHSIVYNKLPFPFFLFALYDGQWASWDEIEEFSLKTGLPTVPVLFRGVVKTKKELHDLVLSLMKEPSVFGGQREGVVVRVAERFNDENFSTFVGKSVRKGHVQTDEHWSKNWVQADIDENFLDLILSK